MLEPEERERSRLRPHKLAGDGFGALSGACRRLSCGASAPTAGALSAAATGTTR